MVPSALHGLQTLPAKPLHAWQVERTFPHIAFETRGDTAVSAQVPEPFSVKRVREMGVRSFVNHLVPASVFGISR
jgi:hypothetical protein